MDAYKGETGGRKGIVEQCQVLRYSPSSRKEGMEGDAIVSKRYPRAVRSRNCFFMESFLYAVEKGDAAGGCKTSGRQEAHSKRDTKPNWRG